jgi:homoaconitase
MLLRQACRLARGPLSSRSLATVANGPKLPFEANCASVTPPYGKLIANLKTVKRILDNEPLTLAEKILYSHLADAEDSLAAGKGNIRGESYLKLNPDRVAMQGTTAIRVTGTNGRCECPDGDFAVYGKRIR